MPRRHPLTETHRRVLRAVGAGESLAMCEIAHRLGTRSGLKTYPRVVKAVARLFEFGYLDRVSRLGRCCYSRGRNYDKADNHTQEA